MFGTVNVILVMSHPPKYLLYPSYFQQLVSELCSLEGKFEGLEKKSQDGSLQDG